MGFQPAFLLLHPPLLEVKAQRQEEQLDTDIPFAVGWLYEAHLTVGFQVQVIIQAFVTGIRRYFLISLLVNLRINGINVPTSVQFENASIPVIYSLFTAIWTLQAGFNCPFLIWSSFIIGRLLPTFGWKKCRTGIRMPLYTLSINAAMAVLCG